MRTLTALFFSSALLLAGGGFGDAAYKHKGLKTYKKGNYATVLRGWRPLVDQGHTFA